MPRGVGAIGVRKIACKGEPEIRREGCCGPVPNLVSEGEDGPVLIASPQRRMLPRNMRRILRDPGSSVNKCSSKRLQHETIDPHFLRTFNSRHGYISQISQSALRTWHSVSLKGTSFSLLLLLFKYWGKFFVRINVA